MTISVTPSLDAQQFDFILDEAVNLRGYRGEETAGTPLVLLHSINAAPSAMEVRPLFEYYRDKRPVWAPDLPGFGISDRLALNYTNILYSRWLAEWLGSLPAAADVIALSLTGEFVARAILEHGANVRSLTLISPTGMGAKEVPSAVGSRVERILGSKWVGPQLFKALTVKASIRWFLGQAFVGPTPEHLINHAWENSRKPGAHWAPLKFLTFSLFTEQAISRLYSRLKLPCFVLYDRDPNIDFEKLPALTEGYENWSARKLAPSLGLPHWEMTRETVSALEEFWFLAEQSSKKLSEISQDRTRRQSA